MKLAKKLDFPLNYTPPNELRHEYLIAKPLTREHLEDDLAAVNSSIELIRKTRGGNWPQNQLTKDLNFLDLAWHEREFREKSSLAYVVYNTDSQYIGCFYLYPIGVRTEYSKKTKDYDVDASWWVSSEAYEQGYYEELQAALTSWLKSNFPFRLVYYSNMDQ
jgi:RimJ/RimL family protein N-acetyltransferase